MGDWSKFFRLVRSNKYISGVEIRSDGGSADDGFAIAKYVHDQGYNTVADGRCHSICTMIFLAGARRYLTPDTVLTMHSAYKKLGDWVITDQNANATAAWFLGHMGYPLELARLWVSTPSDEASPITLQMNEDLQLGFIVVGGDQTMGTTTSAAAAPTIPAQPSD